MVGMLVGRIKKAINQSVPSKKMRKSELIVLKKLKKTERKRRERKKEQS